MYCKSLWINACAKLINVNVEMGLRLLYVLYSMYITSWHRSEQKQVGEMQAPLNFFCQDAYWNDRGSLTSGCVFQLRSYSRDPDKSTGVLGNICGPVLCDGRKGQTEKKGGHLLHMLHLKLVMLAASTGHANLDLAGWLAALSFLSSTLGSSDSTELAADYYSLQVKHKGPGLRSSALLYSFHLELLAFPILLNLHAPYPTHCS